MDYEQMEIDITLESDRDLKENMQATAKFALGQIMEYQHPTKVTALQEQHPHRKRAWQKSPRKSLQDSGEMAMTERTASRQQDMTTMQSRKRSMHSLE